MNGMNNIQNVSRRGVLKGALVAGTLVLGVQLVPKPLWASVSSDIPSVFQPDIFLSIASDGTVSIVASRSRDGASSRTALPLVVPSWRTNLMLIGRKVKIDQAIGDAKYGDQDTDGSHSVRSFFDQMRQVGATGRAMLISAASKQWNVPKKECTTEPGFVVHKASARKLSYGELAAPRLPKLPVPQKEDVPLKNRSEWRYIGKDNALV